MSDTRTRLAAGWAAAYGTLALFWTVTGHGYPFGGNDPAPDTSALRGLGPDVGAPLFAAVLLTAAVALLATAGGTSRGPLRYALSGYLWLTAGALLLLVPDVRLLAFAGYLPMLIAGLPFGWPPVDYGDVLTWTLGNQALALTGGVLIVRAVLTWQRRAAGACEDCGRRDDGEAGWTSPRAAARWGRIAVWIAAACPAVYAVSRLAWAAGIPLGIDAGELSAMRAGGAAVAPAGLGAFALAGAILTLGLTQRWGERFPRWMVGLAGKPVPIRLATVPATIVALLVASASVWVVTGEHSVSMFDGAVVPVLLWPLWSVALGAATYAYHLRRRPPCTRCEGHGNDDVPGLFTGSGTGAY
ncbi:hypothetical protein AB0G04_28015 [Actinoplanes sp. NPDC023801]|uniref:hypothetical protein n=1 Tax=Actinoplanes sp. NPDC023801 TaxID=3154595 RepID=UPI0033C4DA31